MNAIEQLLKILSGTRDDLFEGADDAMDVVFKMHVLHAPASTDEEYAKAYEKIHAVFLAASMALGQADERTRKLFEMAHAKALESHKSNPLLPVIKGARAQLEEDKKEGS